MGMFEKGQISALKLGILLKQYKPYKSSLSDSICFFCHIRHSLKDTKIPDALIFPSPFFGGVVMEWCSGVSFPPVSLLKMPLLHNAAFT